MPNDAEVYQIEGFRLQKGIECCATCAFHTFHLYGLQIHSLQILCAQKDNNPDAFKDGPGPKYKAVQTSGICPKFEVIY